MVNKFRIAVILTVVGVVTFVLLPVQLLGLYFDWPLRRKLPGLWHRLACRLLGIRVHVRGRLEKSRPLLIAANHSSWLDILVLSSVADVVFVAKSEVRSWPVFGTLAKLQASIFVEREDRRKTGIQVNEISSRLSASEIVVLFPEGTTSNGNRMLPVKSSLFGAAASAVQFVEDGVVHIQPVAIAYTRLNGMPMGRYHRPAAAWPGDVELIPHLSGILREGALDAEVTFAPTLHYTKDTNRKQMSKLVEQEISEALAQSLTNPL